MIELHLGNSDCLIFGHLEQTAELFCKYLLIFRQVCFGFLHKFILKMSYTIYETAERRG